MGLGGGVSGAGAANPRQPEPIIRAGQVIALRLFDIAYAIDLKSAEALWAARTPRAGERRKLSGTPPKAMAFGVPPLALTLGEVLLTLGGHPVTATATARLYDFGVAVLAVSVPVAALPWGEFARLVDRVDEAVGFHMAEPWAALLADLRGPIAEALDRPSDAVLEEDYLLGVVNRLDEPLSAEALQQRVDLVPLLAGDQRPLSDGARADLLRNRLSFYTDDLVALTWDRAFVYEPRHDTDVIDVLEVANAQLLEMRFYDELLDAELPRIYDLVEEARRGAKLLAARRYGRLARRLYGLVAEVTELTERVDNALQVTEDVYLARVYGAAMALFRVPAVSAAVDRKLALIRDTYGALYAEASGSRAEWLEVAILLLIAVEIVLSLVRH